MPSPIDPLRSFLPPPEVAGQTSPMQERYNVAAANRRDERGHEHARDEDRLSDREGDEPACLEAGACGHPGLLVPVSPPLLRIGGARAAAQQRLLAVTSNASTLELRSRSAADATPLLRAVTDGPALQMQQQRTRSATLQLPAEAAPSRRDVQPGPGGMALPSRSAAADTPTSGTHANGTARPLPPLVDEDARRAHSVGSDPPIRGMKSAMPAAMAASAAGDEATQRPEGRADVAPSAAPARSDADRRGGVELQGLPSSPSALRGAQMSATQPVPPMKMGTPPALIEQLALNARSPRAAQTTLSVPLTRLGEGHQVLASWPQGLHGSHLTLRSSSSLGYRMLSESLQSDAATGPGAWIVEATAGTEDHRQRRHGQQAPVWEDD